ncbi:hypothetical protein L1887_44470 [Cichorium endivia]|nr:hypothetical protein L1887_44470 [Cichorium endivia]
MKCECQSADDFDVIIVGAGVAGTALAHSLGKEGRRVHLIERDLKQPDWIVGEVLQPGGYRSLIELGLKDCVEDIDAQRVVGIVLEQGTVSCLVEEQGLIKSVVYMSKAGLVLQNCQLPYKKHGHVIIADPSPIVFYPISSTEIRCLVDILGQKVPSVSNGDLSNYLKTVVAPQIPPELQEAFMEAVDKGNMRTMPNRSMPAAPRPTLGLYIASIIPTHSANISSHFIHCARSPMASTINTLVEALYKVFCNKARQETQEACFKMPLGYYFPSSRQKDLGRLSSQQQCLHIIGPHRTP